MNCPICGAYYEEIYAMGQDAPVATIATCSCVMTGNASTPGSFQWVAPPHFSSVSVTPPPVPAVPVPQEPLKPAEEIVADMLDLLDELDDE